MKQERDQSGPPIAVESLRKSFGAQRVLRGLSLQIEQGTTLAVLGRSGTGKSVLLKLLIGLQQPDAGSVRILGHEIAGLKTNELNEIRKKMGFLFQQAALYDALTVAENVEFPLSRHTGMGESERRGKVQELLASVGLDKDLGKMPSEISGGMQKRVGIARALALDPSILLFDEPTSGLDPITATEIARLIADLKSRRKSTAVVVTHDLRVARLFSDRFVLIHEGKVVVDGTYDDLHRSKDEMAVQFLKEGE
jgi:phospholipid/cholesterol/gamma-HCH transport system ATP-binding protein